tara:strand:- start:190 stop:732 length:543 start_codon:yes stop_codon:yes gene_type:complete
MAFQQVDTFTVTSGATNFIIGGGTGGSSTTNFAINTDDIYMVTYTDVYMSNDGAVPALRLTTSGDGTVDSNANYDNARQNIYDNQAHSDQGNENLTYFSSIGTGTTSAESHQGILYLYDFNSSSHYSYVLWEQIISTESPEYISPYGGGVLTTSQTTDGVQFYANSGNINSGTFTMYKMV